MTKHFYHRLSKLKVDIWLKILLSLGIFFTFIGLYLLLKPHLYFCRVKEDSIDRQSLYCLINKTRRKRGLQLFKPNTELEKAARLRAYDMITYNQFSHESISGTTKGEAAIKAGYHPRELGEVLARRFETNEEVFEAWMKSASHSAIILNSNFEDIGVAVLDSDRLPENNKVVVGLFGKEKSHEETLSTFSQMVISTDKALMDFGEIDQKYIEGETTNEEYEEAWYELDFRLGEIKKYDDKLLNPPEELEELVTLYRSGFYRVFSVTSDAVDYLSGENQDPTIVIKDREKFVEGLEMLKEVKSRLGSSEKAI